MDPTFYLLSSLIEMPESVKTQHRLFHNLDSALKAFESEIHSCLENYSFEESKFQTSCERFFEWRNQDGYGFTVEIEEIIPIK